LNAFWDDVWDKLEEQYGRIPIEAGGGPLIDEILVKHRETVIAVALDGLRRHGLLDRVKVICGEPDPDDWQRDRDVTVWPPGGAAEPAAGAGRVRAPGCGQDKAAEAASAAEQRRSASGDGP
jgi:hypothetical protein